MQKLSPYGLLVIAMLTGCDSPPINMEQVVLFSPPAIEVSERPMDLANRLSKIAPRSTVLVGHGNSMLPLYPDGTILVVQEIAWRNLTPGMSVVYGADVNNPYNLVCHVIEERASEREWSVRGLGNAEPDRILVTPENYIGVVIAALRLRDGTQPIAMSASVSQTLTTLCMKCHVHGQSHPNLDDLPPVFRPSQTPLAYNETGHDSISRER
jgi:hypothetical protein